MPVLVKISQNKNDKTTAYGKWYGRVVATKTMSYQELCKHMSEHNSVYGEDVCLGVANKLQNCILEQLLEGKKIQLGDLGAFGISLKSEGAETAEAFTAHNIKAVNVTWDRGPLFEDLITDAEFRVVASRKAQAEAIEEMRGKTGTEDDGEGEDDGDLS